MSDNFKANSTILFQGDSITDCGRNRFDKTSLGNGYVNLINHYFEEHNKNVTCINKGVSGDRSIDLKNRWDKCTLSLIDEVDIFSLYIGINDVWRTFDSGLPMPKEQFREHYDYLLSSVVEINPNIKIILLSPFLLPTKPEQLEWREDLAEKIEVVEEMVDKYETLYIPLQQVFNKKVTLEEPNCYWAGDGVHPTAKGHIVIAKEWIDTII